MEMVAFLTGVVSLIALIVFFVMSSNIADLKRLAQLQVKQNDDLIRLVKKLVNPDQKTMQEILDSGETVYLRKGEAVFRVVKVGGSVQYFRKSKGLKEVATSVTSNQFLKDAIGSEQYITAAEYNAVQ